jgi:hypothetical protein
LGFRKKRLDGRILASYLKKGLHFKWTVALKGIVAYNAYGPSKGAFKTQTRL